MPKICYKACNFRPDTLKRIVQANKIIEEYEAAGYKLTLRQLFYQFVSRDLIPNTQKAYSAIGSVINDARLAGLIDWDAIEDRTRNLHRLSTWAEPSDILESAAASYRTDKWANQPTYIEVWIEKEALAGVFQRVCDGLQVPLFACRGYVSQSEMWSAARRLERRALEGQSTAILHFGDHDPSGIDMTRDIEDRMRLFECAVDVRRLALTMDQIKEYGPPPNPAKATDSRFAEYLDTYGEASWELDALEPRVLASLVRTEVLAERDEECWDRDVAAEKEAKARLQYLADTWRD